MLQRAAFWATTIQSLVVLLAASPSAGAPTVTMVIPSGAQRGATVEVQATGTFEKWPVKVWSSNKSVTVTATGEKGKSRVAVGAGAALGTCWLRWFDDTGASALRPFVIGALPEIAEVEPNDEPGKAQPINGSVVVNGKLAKSGDVDCFALNLKKGQTLVADLVAHETFRSPMDAVLQVVGPEGNTLEQNHDFRGLDPRIVFFALRDANYTVRLFAFPAQPDSTIRYFGSEACVYRLTLSTTEFVDFVTPLAVERESARKVMLRGWNLAATARDLPPSDELSSFVPSTAIRVRREPHPCYDLINAKPDKPLPIPFTATGLLRKPNALDEILVDGIKGKPLTIQLESPSLGLSLSPVLVIRDAGGKQLQRVEPAMPNADVDSAFTPPADGRYRIEVHDLLHEGGPRHAYRLRIAPTSPDFELTLATDRFTASLGVPLDIPITITRRNGFVGDIELAVEGLPGEVMATQLAKSEKPDPIREQIRLVAKREGFAGPIHIVGKAKGDARIMHDATAVVAGLDTTTSDLWLNVIDKVKVK